MYLWIKYTHVSAALLSLAGFLLRGWWMLQDSARLSARPVRVAPHVVDTVLLVSAIALAVLSHQYPVQRGWLTAKVVALLVYIGLGMMALRPGRPKTVRAAAFVAAVGVFFYILGVARSRQPLPWT